MVSTVKFSQFGLGNPATQTNEVVGISSPTGGTNIRYPSTVTWTTLTRPSPPYDGLLGYNTSLEAYEYWNATQAKWVTLATDVSGFNWTEVTTVSVNAAVNSGYVTNRSATAVQVVLPATFALGDEVKVMGLGAAGWSLVANTGQQIQFGTSVTSTAGAISSDIQYGSITVRGLVPSTTWTVVDVFGNPTVI